MWKEIETGTSPYACYSGNTKVKPHVEFVGLGFDLFGFDFFVFNMIKIIFEVKLILLTERYWAIFIVFSGQIIFTVG